MAFFWGGGGGGGYLPFAGIFEVISKQTFFLLFFSGSIKILGIFGGIVRIGVRTFC